MVNCSLEGGGRCQVLSWHLTVETEESQEKHRSGESVQSYHLQNASLGRYRCDNPLCLELVGDGEASEPCRIRTGDLIPGFK